MVPKEWIQPIRNGFRQMRAHSDVFHARLPRQGMVKLYKGSIFVIRVAQFDTQGKVM